jgi:AcrR family transcriptional regulator
MSADPRVRRTRATLRDALMQLLQRKDWSEISTSDICRKAGVARSSFYEHYIGKADLLDEVFAVQMSVIPSAFDPNAPLGTLDWLVEHVARAPDFFAHAFAGGRGDALLPRFRTALTRKLEDELAGRGVLGPGPAAAYIIGGSLAYLAAEPGEGARGALQRLARQVLRA